MSGITVGSEKAVEPLIKALNDENNIVRRRAAKALGTIGSEKAVEPLIKVLTGEDQSMRWHAANALGVIGSEKAVEPLIKALNDEDSEIRLRAAITLGKIGSKKAVKKLKEFCLKSQKSFSEIQAAFEALWEISVKNQKRLSLEEFELK
jgi:HEAT repeat protein